MISCQSCVDVHAKLLDAGAVPRFVGPRIGAIATADGVEIEADASTENEPGFLFDGLVLPDGEPAVAALYWDGHAMEAIRDQYRHCKPILALGTASQLLDIAGVPPTLPDGQPDPGLTITADAAAGADAFIQGLAKHRHPERETDPPAV